jgi:uncharacterized protein (TIGR03790 family)
MAGRFRLPPLDSMATLVSPRITAGRSRVKIADQRQRIGFDRKRDGPCHLDINERGKTLRRIIDSLCCLLLVGIGASPAAAELRPDQVAILCARENRNSQAVAAYYAKVRGVPRENVLALTMPEGETISREDWQTQLRPAIQNWLSVGDRRIKIRCFVTVWDVPLKIEAVKSDPEVGRLVAYLSTERQQRVAQLDGFVKALHQLAGVRAGNGSTSDGPPPTLAPDADLETIKGALDVAFGAAQTEIMKQTDEAARTQALQQLQTIYFRSVGLNMVAQSLQRQLQSGEAGSNPQVRTEFDVSRGRSHGLREGRAALEGIPYGLDREPQLLALLQLSDGLYGTLAWIDEQLNVLKKNESYASFDSELSVVAWPDYALVRWQPNLLNFRYDESPIRDFKITYMVSRIEAPTLQLTRAIIDQAMEVEKSGLKGKVYFDARSAKQPGYEAYDQSLVRAAELIKQHTDLEVVLDMKQELLQPGAAPDAALYCGWYSLGKYVDAFDWAPGAVGYHMASSEATTLRSPESQVWCKKMLEDRNAQTGAGVVATLGPVYEPYIHAFPPPDEFFALLLSGKYTLAEAYYRCLPHTSWTMTLVGDPLYAPFKNSAPLKSENLPEITKRIINGPLPVLEEAIAVARNNNNNPPTDTAPENNAAAEPAAPQPQTTP